MEHNTTVVLLVSLITDLHVELPYLFGCKPGDYFTKSYFICYASGLGVRTCSLQSPNHLFFHVMIQQEANFHA